MTKLINKIINTTNIGWLGTQLLAWCGLPAVIQVISQGHANGYSPLFIAMWGMGEIFTLVYVVKKHSADRPLVINYLINLLFICIIGIYLIK